MTTQCPKCNTKNPDDSKYCKECASPLKPTGDVSVTKTIKTPAKGISKGTIIAGKYQILQKLGEGGMGIVYKAKDSRLDRTVALKFLSSDLIKDEEAKKRFIQEAKAAAALEHPNICTVYEVDEADGQTFIAMSYIEGQSLKEKLKEGPEDVDEAKDIAIQVAEGLREAHEKGIVHRDIKPANIMLTKKGQVKITDFGLAKLSWGVDLTITSTIMGTVAYMSPEQARGEEVDHRTDIWSLGAMMYEMLSGERPFQKSQEQALIYAILNDKPTPLSLLRSDVPGYLEQMIEKALNKKATERYHDIQEMIQDLKPSITFPKSAKSIVVLPFDDLSPRKDNEYFSDGLAEEIISDLSRIQSLRVISRTSAMMFKGSRKSIKTIGRELDVEYVLEGSVRKSANKLRIIAQLIDTKTDAHLWTEKYSGTMDDVFDIQEKVSHSIVDALKLQLTPEAEKKLAGRPINNVKAYEYYLKHKHELKLYSKDELDRALQYLNKGVEVAGENALLYAGIGHVYLQYVNFGYRPEYIDKIDEYAIKALQLDPELPQANYLLGLIYQMLKGNQKQSIFHLKRALLADPDDTDYLLWITIPYISTGRINLASQSISRGIEIDPLNPNFHGFLMLNYFYSGNFEKAGKLVAKTSKMILESPSLWTFWFALVIAYNRNVKEAYAYLNEMERSSFPGHFRDLCLFLKIALDGNSELVPQVMNEEFKRSGERDCWFAQLFASLYAKLEMRDEALDWLEKAVDLGYINYKFLNEFDPFLENIRGELRFKKLMERVKHEWENFEV